MAAAPARAEEPGLWDKMMNTVGMGGKPAASANPAPQAPQAVQAPQAAPAPQAIQAPQAAPAPQAAQQPGMFDKVMGTVGLGAGDAAGIDYSERPKLAVPQQRALPSPNPAPERQVTRRAGDDEALTKPPGQYLQKVTGEDGQVSGLRDSDTAKEKKFFGLF
jgi:hypothetical protein